MKLQAPLLNLVGRCQTLCVAECCGIDAYDFSPIHIASSLIMYRGEPDKQEIATIRAQLEALKCNYGTEAASGSGVTIDDMNQGFTATQIDALADEVLANLSVALQLIDSSEKTQYKAAEPSGPDNPRPCGTSGISPADPASRAGDTPEASGGI